MCVCVRSSAQYAATRSDITHRGATFAQRAAESLQTLTVSLERAFPEIASEKSLQRLDKVYTVYLVIEQECRKSLDVFYILRTVLLTRKLWVPYTWGEEVENEHLQFQDFNLQNEGL